MIIFTGYCAIVVLRVSSVSRPLMVVMVANLSIALFSGIINDNIGPFSTRTFFIFLMPLFAFSAGSILRTRRGDAFELGMYPMFKVLLFALLMQGIVYILFAASGMIGRIGNSIPLIIPIIYLTIYGSPKYVFLAPLAVVFSGKRIVLMFILVLGSVAALRNLKVALKYSLPVLIVTAAGVVLMFEPLSTYLSRWDIDLLFAGHFGMEIIDKFSSGRVGQWVGGIATIDNIFKFCFGSGSGTVINYQYFAYDNGPGETNWYVHNAFITYFVQSGFFGMILLIGMLGRIFWQGNRAEGASFSYYYFLLGIITGLFSAHIVVNPLFWFFSGVLFQAGRAKVRQDPKRLRGIETIVYSTHALGR